MQVSPIEVQRYLGGIDYPADKGMLLDTARRAGAPEDVLIELENIPDRGYGGPQEVTKAVTESEPAW